MVLRTEDFLPFTKSPLLQPPCDHEEQAVQRPQKSWDLVLWTP